MSVTIHGECDQRFRAVRTAFAENFEAGKEVGACFAATINGQPVIDLWAGHADAERTRAWERDTIVNVFSTTKAMTALCAHMLVDRGQLDLDAPVTRYWPEFAQAGKGTMPVRYLLCHQAGLAAIREPLSIETFYDWERMTRVLAAEVPWWEPGTGESGYHALTFGYLIGEVIRRITGKTVGAFFRDEVAGPLGADFYIGLGASEDRRIAEIIPPAPQEAAAVAIDPESMLGKVMMNPPMAPQLANTRPWRGAEIPAANGHGNARSIARVMAALACGGTLDGIQLLRPETLAKAIEVQSDGPDRVLRIRFRWALGFMLPSPDLPIGLSPNPRTFGHGGWGGSLGFADWDARVSWAYAMNKMAPGTTGDSRAAGPLTALYAAL